MMLVGRRDGEPSRFPSVARLRPFICRQLVHMDEGAVVGARDVAHAQEMSRSIDVSRQCDQDHRRDDGDRKTRLARPPRRPSGRSVHASESTLAHGDDFVNILAIELQKREPSRASRRPDAKQRRATSLLILADAGILVRTELGDRTGRYKLRRVMDVQLRGRFSECIDGCAPWVTGW